jgi:tripartite-type tricarboxylate transporter receptor subunit TctC
MRIPRRHFVQLTLGAAAPPALSRMAWAQAYPSRPITMVVPFAPGGASDVIGRILAPKMRASLGQSIVIENVAGAGGSLSTGRVARAAPDGYTFIVGNVGTQVTNGQVYDLKYEMISSRSYWSRRSRSSSLQRRPCRRLTSRDLSLG